MLVATITHFMYHDATMRLNLHINYFHMKLNCLFEFCSVQLRQHLELRNSQAAYYYENLTANKNTNLSKDHAMVLSNTSTLSL